MELALIVLAWTASASVALLTIMATAHIGHMSEHTKARTVNERRMH